MRRIILVSLFLLCLVQIDAQSGQCMITLKNGTVITGVVKSIDPVGDVVISLAGELINLKMTDVAKIEEKTENVICFLVKKIL